MNRHPIACGVIVALAAFVVQPALAQDAAATIKAAQYALGMIRGPQRIDAINTLEYWGTGKVSRLPGIVTYHASLGYRLSAMRVDITPSNADGSNQNLREIQVVSGNFAWNGSVPGGGFTPGTTATPMPGALKDRLLQLWSTPHGALKAAEQAGANAKVAQEGGATVIAFPLSGPLAGVTMKVTLNAKNQVARVETRGPGNTVTETTYSDYKDLGEIETDVLFPLRIVQKQGGMPVFDLTITRTDANNPYVVFPVPDTVERAH